MVEGGRWMDNDGGGEDGWIMVEGGRDGWIMVEGRRWMDNDGGGKMDG